MESQATVDYVELGALLWFLMDSEQGWRIHRPNGFVLGTLENFRMKLENNGFTVSARVATDFASVQRELEQTEPEAVLSAEQAKAIKDTAQHVHKTLYAEAAGKIAFLATDKRYDVNRLLADVSSLMPRGVFDALPEIAKRDVQEAGICIAFERPTAAAFHVLRGTEDALRHWYRPSCFTAATDGTDPVASGLTCSSCWLVRLLVLLSDHADNPRYESRPMQRSD